jgi:hypothetical protein
MRNSNSGRCFLIASLLITGTALSVGCSSGSSSDTGAGGSSSSSMGGHNGTAGSSGTGGAAATHVAPLPYTFDTGLQTWLLSNYADTNSRNLAGNYTTDGGTDAAPADAGAALVAPTLTFDSTVGSPSAGSLKMTATFTDYNQYVDAIVNFSPTIDLTGKTLHASLQLTSGTFSGGAQLHVGTGAMYDGYGQANISVAAAWPFTTVTYVLMPGGASNPSANAAFNPAAVFQIGVQVYSGAPVPDAGTYANAGVPVVFNIDTVTD